MRSSWLFVLLCLGPKWYAKHMLKISGFYAHTGVMDYDEACFMHLTPGVVRNFPKAVGV